MTLTIQLPPELEERARAEAAARGESLPDFVLSLVRGAVGAHTNSTRPERRARRRAQSREMDQADAQAMAALLPGEPVPPPPIRFEEIRGATRDGRLVREPNGDRFYEYYPVTEHIVSAPQTCGGRLTMKGRRLDTGYVLGAMESGKSREQVAQDYRLALEAVQEVIDLAHQNPRDIFERPVRFSDSDR